MRILVIGSGAREHALVWALTRSPAVSKLICAPGNPGIAQLARAVPIPTGDLEGLADLAAGEAIDLTIVGPEQPLADGIADRFSARGLTVLGPGADAARLETSKAFAKTFMREHGVPTARYRVCATADAARAAVREFGPPAVLKADGLAAGKGVVVAEDQDTADAAIDRLMVQRALGAAGARLIVEERLEGTEASYFVLADGSRWVSLGSAQDHKRALDGDRGPNTGGMGAFAPSPLVTPAMEARVDAEIVGPVIEGLARRQMPYRGVLYVGLMLTEAGPKVIEFNVRLGDPEAQVVLPLLGGELPELLQAAALGELKGAPVAASRRPHVGVVLASAGYPGPFEAGRVISGVETAAALEGVLVFHAGTAHREGKLVTAGGRVLTAVGAADDFSTARARAYAAADLIQFDGKHARRDIGLRALSSP